MEKKMAVTVRIPTPLQEFTQNQDAVEIDGSTVKEVLGNLDDQFDGMRQRLYDEEGKLRRFVNIYVNQEDIRFLQGEETEVKEGDELSIVPAIAGGE
jgi:molybdopterin synthase sulfur carrier subunit